MAVDVKLALGQFSLEEAAKYLEKFPDGRANRAPGSDRFCHRAGSGLTYQIGKLQIMQLLAEARLKQGEKFNIHAFHDFVWKTATSRSRYSVGIFGRGRSMSEFDGKVGGEQQAAGLQFSAASRDAFYSGEPASI